MQKVNTDVERCKGCYLCIANCPKEAIKKSGKVNLKGYEYIIVDNDKCISCGSCYQVCPDYVFEVN
ncbi:MAG TPA: 4Fe-4S dicluster domain-containing protein [Mogibacterium sp.]|nr:4Fe-4S dicluster domain-containing protein [Mogibacterium sp.]